MAVLLFLVAATGCGGKGKVSGTVTGPDGKPLPLGRITFVPASGSGATVEIADGAYNVTDLPTGDAKVFVETEYIKENADMAAQNSNRGFGPQAAGAGGREMPPEAAAHIKEMTQAQDEATKKVKDDLAKYRAIADKYTKAETSGLSLTVKSGANNFNVELSK